MFTNMRYTTILRPKACLLLLGRDYHGSNRLFLGSNSPKPSHKYIPLDDPDRWERAAKIRSGKFANFSPRRSIFSVTKTTSNASRAVWLDEVPQARSGIRGKPYGKHPISASETALINTFFFLHFYNFIQSNERRIFRGGEKRALEEDTSWSRIVVEKSR